MNPPFRRATRSPLTGCATWVLAIVSGLVSSSVAAQQNEASPESRTPNIWVEPRISVQHTVTNNAGLNDKKISDQITEVTPGVRWIGNTARIKGFFDYSLTGIHYAREKGADHLRHQLNANGTVEVIDQRFFVDVAGVVATQPISAFGAPAGVSPANANDSQTSSFRISPYLRGRFGSLADYQARYSVQDTRTGTGRRSAILTQDALLQLDNRRSGQILGWSVAAQQQALDYSLGRRIDTSTLRGNLFYAITPQLTISGIGGAEATNQLSAVRETSSIWGAGAVWRPSERTSLSLERERRYFGNSHNVALEHRTGRTVWRYTDTQGVSNGQDAQGALQGSQYELWDRFYAPLITDPIERDKLVRQTIAQQGPSSNLQMFPDFLRSASTVQRMQQLSLALLGRRSSVTLVATRSDNRRVDGSTLPLGDDFDANTRIRQHGWSLLLAHRLSPNTSVNAGLVEQRSAGTVLGLKTRVQSLTIGAVTLVAPRTSAGLQLRHIVSDGAANPYSESAIVGTLTHRF